MTDQNINLGLNAKECLKSTNDLTQTTYHDVCTGVQHVIPHGTIDYIMVGFFGIILALMLVLLFCLVKMALD